MCSPGSCGLGRHHGAASSSVADRKQRGKDGAQVELLTSPVPVGGISHSIHNRTNQKEGGSTDFLQFWLCAGLHPNSTQDSRFVWLGEKSSLISAPALGPPSGHGYLQVIYMDPGTRSRLRVSLLSVMSSNCSFMDPRACTGEAPYWGRPA